MDQVEWRDVIGYERFYRISEFGETMRVGSKMGAKVGRILSTHFTKNGYKLVDLYGEGGARKKFLVHRLVAAAWIGPRPDGLDVNHKDGNKENNHYGNLEYMTRSDNMLHASRNGLVNYATGENAPTAVMTWGRVREMRRLYVPGKVGYKRLAKQFGISIGAAHCIVKGRTWKDEVA